MLPFLRKLAAGASVPGLAETNASITKCLRDYE